MAQRSVEILIGRLVTDEAFRAAFRGAATATVTAFMESGYELTPVEITALGATPAEVWERVAEQIDPRLQKASLSPEGGVMAFLELGAHMKVRPGCLDGFKRQAAECIRLTREKDTRTLRYDWYLSLDGTECEVREAYTGPEGLIEHNRNILEARTRLFEDFADGHFMTVYGEVSEPLLDLLKTHHVGYTWFTFLRGLEPSAVFPLPQDGRIAPDKAAL